MATVPVFILLPSHLIFKERLTLNEVFGAILSVIGMMIFFI
jgi:drug/metabolite transporter (DMT)-like permease